ncbi:MAG: dockerin type I repeat-containing protein [Prevotella sp.]|nr:dockerin type I repeat-containing protein [Prevotella sp.]
MKKIYVFLTMLMLAAGSANVMADNWSIDFRGLVTENTSVDISTTETIDIDGTTLGTCSYNGIAIDSKFVLQTATSWLMRAGGLYQFNGGDRAFGLQNCTQGQIITITASGDPSVSTNATLKSSANGTYIYTVTADGGVKFTPVRYLWFYTITVEDPSADNVSYTVKFVDDEGNTLKDDVVYQELPGTPITIMDSDKANFEVDGVVYTYVSDNAEGQTVAADGKTVVTIVFKKASLITYFVNAVDDEENQLAVVATGEFYEGETKLVYYTKGINVDGTWYLTEAKSDPYYGVTMTPTYNTVNVKYSPAEIDYFTEVESLTPSHSWATMGSVPGRYANGQAPRLYKNSYVKTDALPAGIYTVTLRARNQSGSQLATLPVHLVDPNGNLTSTAYGTFEEWSGGQQAEKSVEGVVVPEGYAIALNNATEWNSNLEMDYLIMVRTGDPEVCQYTVKYVDESGTELKDADIRTGALGVEITLAPSDKEPITVSKLVDDSGDEPVYEDVVYVYQSDDSEGKVVAAGAVVTVTFREAQQVPYTVTAVDSEGNELGTVAEGTITETLSQVVYYTKAIEKDGQWYAIEQNSTDPYYGLTLTAGENPTLTYSEVDYDYFSEIEYLQASHSWAANGAFPSRYSNGQAKRLYKDSYVKTDVLPAGKYTVTLRARNNSRNDATLSVGIASSALSATFGEFEAWSTAAQAEKTFENVNVPEGFGIAIVNTSAEYNSNLEMDYIYLKRTGDFEGVPGDVNGDGIVTITDAALVIEYCLTGVEPATFILSNADANNDGSITITDAAFIVEKAMGGN